MNKLRTVVCHATLLLAICSLLACKISDDATAASQQMTAAATNLNGYYTSLAESISSTIALNELDASFSKVPFDTASRRILQETLAEISKRKEAAQALARLAAAMSALSGSKAPSDVASAATALGNELVHVKALPGGSQVPDMLGKAGNLLLQYVQQRKEKEAARAMDETLAAVVSLFEKEKPTYDAIFRSRIFLAKQITKDLIGRHEIDPSPMLVPALKPFNLVALPVDAKTRDALQSLALSRLDTSAEDAAQAEMKASAAMLATLQEMSTRVHTLATEKRMPARGNPFSLKFVQSWLASAI